MDIGAHIVAHPMVNYVVMMHVIIVTRDHSGRTQSMCFGIQTMTDHLERCFGALNINVNLFVVTVNMYFVSD